MRIQSLLQAVAVLLATSFIVSAQDNKPATNAPVRRSQAPPFVSPELLPDGGVTFRFRAPKATEVKAAGQFGPDAVMKKDDQGVCSVTVPSVPAGVHEYRFTISLGME